MCIRDRFPTFEVLSLAFSTTLTPAGRFNSLKGNVRERYFPWCSKDQLFASVLSLKCIRLWTNTSFRTVLGPTLHLKVLNLYVTEIVDMLLIIALVFFTVCLSVRVLDINKAPIRSPPYGSCHITKTHNVEEYLVEQTR